MSVAGNVSRISIKPCQLASTAVSNQICKADLAVGKLSRLFEQPAFAYDVQRYDPSKLLGSPQAFC